MSRLIMVAIAAVILDVFALIDLRYVDAARIRTMNKLAWALIIILLPIIGALLWFLVGRGGRRRRATRGPSAPDDDPEFLRRIRIEQESEERIRRLEQELAELNEEAPGSGASGSDEPGPLARGDDGPADPPSGESSGR